MRNKSFNEKQTEDLAHKIRFHEENRESGYLQDFCKEAVSTIEDG